MEPVWITGIISLVTGATASLATIFVTSRKHKLEAKLEYSAEHVVRKILKDDTWNYRQLGAFTARLRGLSDDEVRRILIRAGAVSMRADGREVWGLLERNNVAVRADEITVTLETREILIEIGHRTVVVQQTQDFVQQQQQQQMQRLSPAQYVEQLIVKMVNNDQKYIAIAKTDWKVK